MLSAEIIVIALGTVASQPFGTQLAVLTGISLIMTVGVYGLVAGIVKMDDAGLYLHQRPNPLARGVGKALLLAAPRLMQLLSVVGTAAMFMVGGGILTHGIPGAHDLIHHLAGGAASLPAGALLALLIPTLLDVLTGIVAGSLALLALILFQRMRGQARPA